jgi:hypothetical protein
VNHLEASESFSPCGGGLLATKNAVREQLNESVELLERALDLLELLEMRVDVGDARQLVAELRRDVRALRRRRP